MPGVSTQHRLALVWLTFTVLAVLMLVLSACAAPGDREPEFDATTEPSRKPTAVPEERPTPDPTAEPEECWDGVLSAEPLHCYILQQAQEQGLLAVDAIYDVWGHLRVYVKQDGYISDETSEFLRAKTAEFLSMWPGQRPNSDKYRECRRQYSYDDCILEIPTWFALHDLFLPWPSEYASMALRIGGKDIVRSEPGWASWRQLWPRVDGGRSAVPSPREFDVSDVDLTDIPDADCGQFRLLSGELSGCGAWERHPNVGIAGWNSERPRILGDTFYYIQVKSPPRDKGDLKALKRELVPGYGDGRSQVVIIPVKYDFEELWRWAIILERFALSAGNTVGITGSSISSIGSPGPHVIPVGEPPPSNEKSERRTKIRLWSHDPPGLADALPDLLPLLGIPVDAVGEIFRSRSLERPILRPLD